MNVQNLDSEQKEPENSDDSCVIVANLFTGHTCRESDSSSGNEKSRVVKKLKKQIPQKDDSQSTDSSVEIIDVILPYAKLVEEKKNMPTQDLDTIDLWERLVEREEESQPQYDAE